jgi:thioredoxin-related protein
MRHPVVLREIINMKRWLAGLVALTLICRAGAEELEWLTDVPAAMAKAKAENKIVLLDFTGSDWCGWCMKLKADVFSQPDFISFAKANLVMVELDYPRSKPQDDALKQANAALAKQYEVDGYPTLILLNGAGEQLDKTVGYLTAGLPGYLDRFKKLPGMPHPDAASSAPSETPDPPRHAPVYAPLPQVAPVQYGDLALKGISIGPAGRMAMINNETLAVGETASIKVKDGHVEVVCKEIRDDSALVTVDGKLVELKMGQH